MASLVRWTLSVAKDSWASSYLLFTTAMTLPSSPLNWGISCLKLAGTALSTNQVFIQVAEPGLYAYAFPSENPHSAVEQVNLFLFLDPPDIFIFEQEWKLVEQRPPRLFSVSSGS